MSKPISFSEAMVCLKNIAPTSKVKRGVSAFRIPETELFSLVPAAANRKEGIRFPRKPLRNITGILFLGTFRI
jgi:hypothetical protein